MNELKLAHDLVETDPDEALKIANRLLNKKFDDPAVLFLIGFIFLKADRVGLAQVCFRRSSELAPHVNQVWNNLGRCYQEGHNLDEAEKCFMKALSLDPNNTAALNNLGLIYVNRCKPHQAIQWADKALKIDPTMKDAMDNRGLACLMLGNWKAGWEGFRGSEGGKFRPIKKYRHPDEPAWNGEKGKTVVVYSDQGLGDEISFASCIPDLIRDSKKVIIECDSRLEGLFRRSFPKADVYGTRRKEHVEWASGYDIDYSVMFSALPGFYRNKTEDFPGTPYLVPDPERIIQWKALLSSLGPEPKIGIAWTGGLQNTGLERRSVSLQPLLPLLKQKAHFVSLQYKDVAGLDDFCKKHEVKIHHWKRGVQTDDYDDTAALVSELDLVVSVTTAVVHLSGAIGKRCLCLVPEKPRWFYGLKGDSVPWYKSVELYRQEDGRWPIARVINALFPSHT